MATIITRGFRSGFLITRGYGASVVPPTSISIYCDPNASVPYSSPADPIAIDPNHTYEVSASLNPFAVDPSRVIVISEDCDPYAAETVIDANSY